METLGRSTSEIRAFETEFRVRLVSFLQGMREDSGKETGN